MQVAQLDPVLPGLVRIRLFDFYTHKINCPRYFYRAFCANPQAQYSDIVWSVVDGRRVGRYERGGKKHKRIRGGLDRGIIDAITRAPQWESLALSKISAAE